MSDPAAVYRFHGADGGVLYIGASRVPLSRFRAHMVDKNWRQIANISIEWHPSWRDATAAEKAAIKAEQPPWNSVHTDRHRERSLRHLRPVDAERMSELVDMVVNWKPTRSASAAHAQPTSQRDSHEQRQRRQADEQRKGDLPAGR